ncbi:hypothetical protein O6H91_02G022100 [Diphasiastrum complanatum]|uniref:Uncharacterized protein n=1 Tax=Diphasiastrum complanatum TaxID=34168 RepID=A0ACC2EDW5_DIPCM|nr:hypothetical protein O6H91_02G022100 [Diphasiastrum complanatum]
MEAVHSNCEKGSTTGKAIQGDGSSLNGRPEHAGTDDKVQVLASMRKAVEERGCSVKGVDDATLLRFLRARSMAVDKAAKMFIQHQNWRASFMPLGYVPDEEIHNELESKKIFLQGTSKQGWPIVVGIARNHHAGSRDLDELKRFVAHVLDKILASAPPGVERMLVIIDLQQISLKNIDVRGAIAGFSLLQILFVEHQQTNEMLLQDIELPHIPKIYGGQEELVLLQDVKLTNWPRSVQ